MNVAWTITAVEPQEGFILRLTFADGMQGDIDMGPRIWGPAFEAIRGDIEVFRSVSIDDEGGTIVWPNGADYAPDALYDDLKLILSGQPDPEKQRV
jgi:hypothetical protein